MDASAMCGKLKGKLAGMPVKSAGMPLKTAGLRQCVCVWHQSYHADFSHFCTVSGMVWLSLVPCCWKHGDRASSSTLGCASYLAVVW